MATVDRIYWLHALTPLHVGAGKGEGYIDLPLMREKLTNFPFVPGSSVKGVFADRHEATDQVRDPEQPDYNAVLHAAFGRAGDDVANAGALVFTDARLICLPVRSLLGTFAWCTSPIVLQRLTRDLEAAGLPGWPAAPTGISQAQVPDSANPDPVTVLAGGNANSQTIYLEDLDLGCRKTADATAWGRQLAGHLFPAPPGSPLTTWARLFMERFVILPDDVFAFLADTATEIQPHVRIDPDFKRVEAGALWYEESLPAESILCGLVWCDPPAALKHLRPQVSALLAPCSVQLGGKATTGKGRVQMRFSQAPAPPVGTAAGGTTPAGDPAPQPPSTGGEV